MPAAAGKAGMETSGKDVNSVLLRGVITQKEVASHDVVVNPPEVCKTANEFAEPEIVNSESEVDIFGKDEKEPRAPSQLLKASAPELDGETKDDVVAAESGGEVEDSEDDDEWNYFKVESEVRVPVDGSRQPCDLVLSGDETKEEKTKMNSLLNPDAAEFIPVSSPPMMMAGEDESPMQTTPVKSAIPPELADIVSASPNWSTMDNQTVPDESAFLEEIKSRPSNIFEEVRITQREDFGEFKPEENEPVSTSGGLAETEETAREMHGIYLAKDMTSSFLDPSTMHSTDEEASKEEIISDASPSEVVEPVMEEKKIPPSHETPPQVEQIAKLEPERVSEPEELMMSAPGKESDLQITSSSPEEPKLSEVEAVLSPESESSTVPLADVQPPDLPEAGSDLAVATPPSTPLPSQEINSEPVDLNKTIDISEVEEDSLKKVVAAAGAGAAAGVTAAAALAAAVKKDAKKASPKTPAGSKATKPAPAKPASNGTKPLMPAKRPSAPSHPVRTTAKTASHTTPSTSPTKTTASALTSSAPRTTAKPAASPVGSASNRVPTRPKPAPASAPTRTPISRTTAATTSSRPASTGPKPLAKATGTAATTGPAASKPKPRVSSAPVEKRTSTSLNGDAKTATKRTETTTAAAAAATKKPAASAASSATTRVSLSARSAAAPPARPSATATAARTATPKPRTTPSSNAVAATRQSPAAKKSTIGSDKQAKEMANRLTLRTTTTTTTTAGSQVTRTNGIGHGKTTSSSAAAANPSKSKKPATTAATKTRKADGGKTDEIKADEKTIETTAQILNETMENNKNNINLIDPVSSD